MDAPEGYAKELDFILRVMRILAPSCVVPCVLSWILLLLARLDPLWLLAENLS